jgi:hypothetical protein
MKRVVALCFLPLALCQAVETPPRLFFSDAKLSFLVPEPWEVPSSFPYGPLLTRKTQEGTDAFIQCQISDPVDPGRLSAEASVDILKKFAGEDMASRSKNSRQLAAGARTFVGKNAYEATWVNEGPDGVVQYQSVYFFMDNRYYVLSLRASRDSFPWIVEDFQNWLATVHLLSRRDAGKLEAPAHGGLWVHQTAGAKIAFPDNWLIGVADDRQVGAAAARDKMHLSFTATVDVMAPASKEFDPKEKEEARRVLTEKGYTIVSESDEPFHGLPSFRVAYEGTIAGRFIRGQDLWAKSPKGHWLISLDGDGPLLRQLSDEWQGILNGIHFFE